MKKTDTHSKVIKEARIATNQRTQTGNVVGSTPNFLRMLILWERLRQRVQATKARVNVGRNAVAMGPKKVNIWAPLRVATYSPVIRSVTHRCPVRRADNKRMTAIQRPLRI